MFIGHFALGFGAKKFQPEASLGALFLAAQFLDLLWPTLLLLGFESVKIVPGITSVTPLDFTSYPISHSLLAVAGWAVLIGGIYGVWKKDGKGGLVVGILVISHWFLDLLVHRPDLPLYPGASSKYGMGLWNSLPLSLIVEFLLYAICIYVYLKTTKAVNRKGSYGIWSLIVFLLLIHLMNLTGPPPPNETAIARVGQLQWIFVLWAWWADRNRAVVVPGR